MALKFYDTKYKLKEVTIAFPAVYETAIYNDVPSEFYSGVFLLNKKNKDHIEQYNKIRKTMDFIQKDNDVKLPPDRICLKDGDITDSDESVFSGHYYLTCKNKQKPLLFDKFKETLPTTIAKNQKPVLTPGSTVNAVFSLWYMDGRGGGKRINARLFAIQIIKQGGSLETPIDENEMKGLFSDYKKSDDEIDIGDLV